VTAAQRRTVSHPRRTARRGPAGRRVWRPRGRGGHRDAAERTRRRPRCGIARNLHQDVADRRPAGPWSPATRAKPRTSSRLSSDKTTSGWC